MGNSNKKPFLNSKDQFQLSLKQIGPLIKASREEKEISIEDLSEMLKISEDYLLAIENGNESYLPESVYVKAMVKRISDKIGLKLTKSTNDEINLKQSKKFNSEIHRQPNFKINYLLITIFSLATLLLGAISTKIGIKLFLERTQQNQNLISLPKNSIQDG